MKIVVHKWAYDPEKLPKSVGSMKLIGYWINFNDYLQNCTLFEKIYSIRLIVNKFNNNIYYCMYGGIKHGKRPSVRNKI
jgi:hypothetical protein